MIIIIDNYDSFTQNLYQYTGELGYQVTVQRTNELLIETINNMNPTHIIISPGPGRPQDSDKCIDIVKSCGNKIPILGICLGHQSIGYACGGIIEKLSIPKHGKVSNIIHNGEDIFRGLHNPMRASRYHSLVVSDRNLPNTLEITASTSDGVIMGCRHRIYKRMQSIQFHPESLWTEEGKNILKNFLLL